jgi:hypothetical protein
LLHPGDTHPGFGIVPGIPNEAISAALLQIEVQIAADHAQRGLSNRDDGGRGCG